jgi:multidrug efflux pump subunit AcrB
VTVTIKAQYHTTELPQVWDELRRKVGDARRQLPPGAGEPVVLDDFGDVYGIFYAITGPGYTDAQLYEVAKDLRRELLLVQDVMRIEFFGRQQEAIYVEIARDRAALLGVRPEQIFAVLRQHNLVAPAGEVDVGPLAVVIRPTGDWGSVEDFENLVIRGATPGSAELIFLRDVATVTRGYVEPPTTLLRHDGEPALGLGISTIGGGDVVRMGAAVEARVRELLPTLPPGIQLNQVSFQANLVVAAVNDFMVNLASSIVIVFVTLLLAMGLRSGLIIGAILFINICGTILVMWIYDMPFERVSLGAMIIALVMLVDNAIVIVEGMLVSIERGVDGLKAAAQVVTQTFWPLLGSTVIAILAFAPIGFSPNSTGEFTRSLLLVLFISLSWSWVTGVTVTPLFCYLFLRAKPPKPGETAAKDPYDTPVYRTYRRLLVAAMRGWPLTLAGLVGMLAAAVFGFRFVDRSFFPDSTRPQYLVDIWAPTGTRLAETERIAAEMAVVVRGLPGVTHVTTSVGQGTLRFLLTYAPERFDTGFAQLIVDVPDIGQIGGLIAESQGRLSAMNPAVQINARRFLQGPGEGGRIQARFFADDYDEARRAATAAMDILRADGGGKGIRLESRDQVPVLQPQFSETQARLTGIQRTDLGAALEAATVGRRVGVFREGEELVPIVSRAPAAERSDPEYLNDVQVFSPVAGQSVPVRQVVSGFAVGIEDPIIFRRDRQRLITVHADSAGELPSVVLERVKAKIEAIPLPPGARLEWGGEHEDSRKAQAALASQVPPFVLLMVLIVVALFNNLRVTAIIWLTVPLSVIGITAGLLMFQKPFGFLALLGALSLSGMLIKNAIVLIDEIRLQLGSGREPWQAVADAAVSRVRPVSMAALTTTFGLIPLMFDPFFDAMAVTIVVGMLFATVLTLFIVPVLYVAFFRIRPKQA